MITIIARIFGNPRKVKPKKNNNNSGSATNRECRGSSYAEVTKKKKDD